MFLLALLAVVTALGAADAILVPRVERAEVEHVRQHLARLAAAVADDLRAAGPNADADAVAKRLTPLLRVRVTFIAANGTVLGDGDVPAAQLDSVENHANRPEVQQAVAGRTGSDVRLSATVSTRFLYVALPAVGVPPVITRVALPLDEVDAGVARLRHLILFAGGAGLLAAAVLSILTTTLVSRRLRQMTTVARNLVARRFSDRIADGAPDEVGELGLALNQLSSDLERTLTDLTRERDLLGAVLHAMADGVLVMDARSQVLGTNPALEAQIGVRAPARGGAPPTILEATRSPALAAHVTSVLRVAAAEAAEIEFPGPPARTFLVRSAPLAGAAGVVSVFHDVTDVRRLEKMRRDFVANVSHELRTPVAAIQAAAETLLGGALGDPPRAREFSEIVARNAERLGQLISDLLDLTRLDSGKLELAPTVLPLRDSVDAVLATLTERIAAKGLLAANQVAPQLEVMADGRALERVLSNLLDNAVKYTPANGRVDITAAAEGDLIHVRVRDTGPGLLPDQRERVFERFYRVDPGRSRALGGTGLGLSIVKHLVEAMGGRVGVESNGGSSFWFTIPAA